MSQRTGPIRLPIARGWLLLLLAIILATAAAFYDRSLKVASHPGFLPPERGLTIAMRDLPYCWDTFARLPTGQTLDDGLAVLRQDFERVVRIATGIRPTPARWSTWLGRQAIFARSGEAWGFCVHPGLLLRTVKVFTQADEPVARYGDIYFAWKEGFLLASLDKTWVQAALDGEALEERLIPGKTNGIEVSWETGTAMVSVAPGLPLSATLHREQSNISDTRRQRLPIINDVLMGISAKDAVTLAAVLSEIAHWFEDFPAWQEMRVGADERLAQWQTKPDAIVARLDRDGALALSLSELETIDSIPVPTFTLLQQRRRDSEAMHPLTNVLPNATVLPGHWNDIDGHQVPLLGPALVLCMAADPEYWYTASREPAMNRLTADTPGQSVEAADAIIHLNWPEASRTFTPMLRETVADGEHPEYTASYFDRTWLPLLQDIERLGAVVIQLGTNNNAWNIGGHLDLRDEVSK